MPEAVIVDTVRTPIGRAFKGSLAQLRPDEMGAYVVDQLLERNPEVNPAEVEDHGVGAPCAHATSLGSTWMRTLPASLCALRTPAPARSAATT